MELKRDKLLSLSAFSGSMLNKIISGILVFYGGCQVMTGAMTIGSFSAIMMYLMQLTGLCRLLARLYENIANSAVSAARLLEMLNTAPKILDGTQALHHRITQGGIDFKDVSFGYKENSLILKNMNFSITPGSKIAITGLSGCGKTTLLSLILRMYDVTSGAIFVDGVDVRGVSREALTSSIAIVLQEPFLWNDTIADNIVYGLEHVTAQHVVEAAKIAEIHDFIVSLEDGYDSPIGEMACLLSEGQKQRLAIARALIRKPTFLLFDEAFSSIDSETENRIIDNINTYFKNTTVMIVSHRISTVQRMESVYFFKNNSCIIKSGHNDLIRNNAAYKELFLGQCV